VSRYVLFMTEYDVPARTIADIAANVACRISGIVKGVKLEHQDVGRVAPRSSGGGGG
jgi:hypothetical protein